MCVCVFVFACELVVFFAVIYIDIVQNDVSIYIYMCVCVCVCVSVCI